MSKKLMTLLGRPDDALLRAAFTDLEKATHSRGIDAKLVGDITGRGHAVLRQMGMTDGATAKEVYQALRVHDELLDDETAYVGKLFRGQVVSFCREDIRADEAVSCEFADRSLVYMQRALAQEIARRYTEWAVHPELITKITAYIKEQ